jgi:hypothetical protein
MKFIHEVEDCRRIRDVLLAVFSIEATLAEVQAFWEHRSSEVSASWLGLPHDYAGLVDEVRRWFPFYAGTLGYALSETHNPLILFER